MNKIATNTWQQYEAGCEYKRRLGLYETVRKNESFYRGDQWQGGAETLPHPVFNVVRRVVDYLIGAVLPEDISIHFSDEKLPYVNNAAVRRAISEGLTLLDRNAAYRWRRSKMTMLVHRALLNAAISGDGVFYCWWDSEKDCGQPFLGDIRTDLLSNTDLFVADVNSTDLQSQEYIILSGRAMVDTLRREALLAGVDEETVKKITPDSEKEGGAFAGIDMEGAEKATYLLKFYRENGEVVFEKSTRNCLIRRVHTGLHRYPVAYFNWFPVQKCFHGASPITDMIPNQKYINTAYAMMMKHMSDTAFSKIIYDKSRIPEWSNEVGEAIAAMGGGNVSDAVSVVGVGQMQEGYLDLINNVIENTKSMMGATESALGDERARNTSAIIALQEASRISLLGIDTRLSACLSDLAAIWADMLCTYCADGRLLPFDGEDGLAARSADYALLRQELLCAAVEIGHTGRYSPSTTVSTLNKLLEEGHLTTEQYLKFRPCGVLSNRDSILQEITMKG